MKKTISRIIVGIITGFFLYIVFLSVFIVFEDNLIFKQSMFTQTGFIIFMLVATLEFEVNFIGVWPKEKNNK